MLACLSIVSCEQSKFPSQYIANNLEEIELQGQRIFQDEISILYAFPADSFLFIQRYLKNDTIFSIYNNYTGAYLGRAGQRGVGPLEFIASPQYYGTKYIKNNLCQVVLHDPPKKKLHYIDVNSTVRSKRLIASKTVETPKELEVDNIFPLSDNQYIGIKDFENSFFNWDATSNTLTTKSIYGLTHESYSPSIEDKVNSSLARLKPDGLKFINVMRFIPRFDIYTSEGDHIMGYLQEKEPHTKMTPDEILSGRLINYYDAVEVTDDHIYLLEVKQPFFETADLKTLVRLRVFDWNGTPLKTYLLDQYVNYFSLNEKENVIYAIDLVSDALYKYQL